MVAAALVVVQPTPAERGHVALGVLGDPGRFLSLTGQQTTTRLLIAGWNQNDLPALLRTMGTTPMLGINSGSNPSPAAIARGDGDAFLVRVNQAIHDFGG